MMKLVFRFMKETKGCYRFETALGPDWTALYLKKRAVDGAGIDPYNGVTITITENAVSGGMEQSKPPFGFNRS